jgi:hypothetical protein
VLHYCTIALVVLNSDTYHSTTGITTGFNCVYTIAVAALLDLIMYTRSNSNAVLLNTTSDTTG